MVLKEEQLRGIVRNTIVNMLRESIDTPDEWVDDDEMDDEEIDDTEINLDIEDEPEDNAKTMAKQERARELIKSILAKQGYKGEALDREVDKRMSKNKVSANTAMSDSFFNNTDDVWVGGKNYGYVDSGVGYDGDFDELYEGVKKNVMKMLKEYANKH